MTGRGPAACRGVLLPGDTPLSPGSHWGGLPPALGSPRALQTLPCPCRGLSRPALLRLV